ncbi:aldo/keto reductase [Cetobacterium sp. 2G large]|uniref:aldo/keto reductase n=2 Tax=unclassified Cetobacterium TaxID=2630983 RepID=UPI00163B8923|nr:aldo/keto reductase [Cetobacterium sp. 2G large]MBC2852316.1 aldo/keto reductase [Cetobacterium sp. 2G large]
MIYKQFKALNNEKLSSVGFGCWAIGGTWNNTEDQKSIETIKKAVELGINFFDVAPIYGMGHSEKILGEALKDYDRSSLFIATKCGLIWDENKVVTKSISRESLYKELNASLERLQTSYIDLYQIHWPFEGMELEEGMATLMEMKEKGLIRYIGLSNFSLKDTKKCMELAEISTLQGLYNMLEPNSEIYHHKQLEYRTANELLPLCKEEGMAFLPYSPLMQGLLTGEFKLENNFDSSDDRSKNPKLNGERFLNYFNCVEELKEIAQEIGKPLSQVAINWLIAQKEVGPVICGAQTPQQIEENVRSTTWELEEKTIKKIEMVLNKKNIC